MIIPKSLSRRFMGRSRVIVKDYSTKNTSVHPLFTSYLTNVICHSPVTAPVTTGYHQVPPSPSLDKRRNCVLRCQKKTSFNTCVVIIILCLEVYPRKGPSILMKVSITRMIDVVRNKYCLVVEKLGFVKCLPSK